MHKMVKDCNNGHWIRQKGFSLLELTFVIMISAVIMLTFVQAYTQYLARHRLQTTDSNMAELSAAISDFYISAGGRYPCPANRALPPTHAYYLREDCSIAGIESAEGNRDVDGNGVIDNCKSGGGLCIGVSDHDRDNDGRPDFVLIGAVPLQTIREITGKTKIPIQAGQDGWGNFISYAVTQNLSLEAPTEGEDRHHLGVISAEDENGRPTAGIRGDAHYALISHGPNGNGAFTPQGVRHQPCDIQSQAVVGNPGGSRGGNDVSNRQNPGGRPTASTAGGKSSHVAGRFTTQNCNDTNATFVQTIGNMRDNSDVYDDRTLFQKTTKTALWGRLPARDGGSTFADITNLNAGNVGVGLSDPQERLDVGGVTGVIRAESSVAVNRICSYNGEHCMNLKGIEGVGMGCQNPNEAIKAIRFDDGGDLTPECEAPQYLLKMQERAESEGALNCPDGEFMRGVKSNGELVCGVVPD